MAVAGRDCTHYEPVALSRGMKVYSKDRRSTALRWKSRNDLCPSVNPPTFNTLRVSIPILSSDGWCATGEMINVPLSSNPMNPRSNR
jgi:hypothetical protein